MWTFWGLKAHMSSVDSRPLILLLVPVPPPYSGPEVLGELLVKGGLGPDFRCHHVRANVTSRNAVKGNIRLRTIAAFLAVWTKLVWSLIRYRPTIVFFYLSQNQSGFFRDALVTMTARLAGAGVVVQIHGSNFENFFLHCSRPVRGLIRFVVRRFSGAALLAERFRYQLRDLLPDQRVGVLYNAVDFGAFKWSVPAARKSHPSVRIVFAGHLSVAKGFCDLLEVAPAVLDAVSEASLEFFGEWLETERNVLYDESGQPLEPGTSDPRAAWGALQTRYGDRVRHYGSVPREQLAASLVAADVFVLPSYSEGFPMAVLEAMASGLPLVVTPVGALGEVLEDGVNGIFVKPGDRRALTAALVELARRPDLRERMGSVNRELARSRFSPDKMRDRLAGLLNQWIRESAKGTCASEA